MSTRRSRRLARAEGSGRRPARSAQAGAEDSSRRTTRPAAPADERRRPAPEPQRAPADQRDEREAAEFREELDRSARRVDVDDLVREGRTKNLKMIKERDLRAVIARVMDRFIEEHDIEVDADQREALLQQTQSTLKSNIGQLKQLQEQAEQREAELAGLREEQEELRRRAEAAESDRAGLQVEISELESRLATAGAQGDTRAATLERENAELRERLEQAAARVSPERHAATVQARALAEGELAATRSRLQALEEETAELRDRADHQTGVPPAKVAALRRSLDDYLREAQSQAHPDDNQELLQSWAAVRNDQGVISAAAECIRHLDAHLSRARDQAAAGAAADPAAAEGLAAAEARAAELQGRLDEAEAQLATQREEEAALAEAKRRALADRDTALEDLKSATSAQEKAIYARDAARSTRDAERRRVQELQRQLAERERQIETLKAEHPATDALRARSEQDEVLKELRRRVEDLQLQGELQDKENKDLEAALERARSDALEQAQRVNDMEKAAAAAPAEDGRVADLERNLEQSRLVADRLREQLAEAQERARPDTTVITRLEAERDRLRGLVDTAEGRAEQAEERAEGLSEQLRELHDAARQHDGRIAELETALHQARSEQAHGGERLVRQVREAQAALADFDLTSAQLRSAQIRLAEAIDHIAPAGNQPGDRIASPAPEEEA